VAVGVVLSALDLLVYFCTLGPLFTILKLLKPKPTVKAITNASDAPRRRTTAIKEMLKTPFPEAHVYTLHDLMWHCGKIYSDRPCFGTRAFLGDGTADPEKGQRFPPKVFGETSWMTVNLIRASQTPPCPPQNTQHPPRPSIGRICSDSSSTLQYGSAHMSANSANPTHQPQEIHAHPPGCAFPRLSPWDVLPT